MHFHSEFFRSFFERVLLNRGKAHKRNCHLGSSKAHCGLAWLSSCQKTVWCILFNGCLIIMPFKWNTVPFVPKTRVHWFQTVSSSRLTGQCVKCSSDFRCCWRIGKASSSRGPSNAGESWIWSGQGMRNNKETRLNCLFLPPLSVCSSKSQLLQYLKTDLFCFSVCLLACLFFKVFFSLMGNQKLGLWAWGAAAFHIAEKGRMCLECIPFSTSKQWLFLLQA